MAVVDGLCTLAEARASLGWAVSDTANDADLERYIEAATPLIEKETGPMVIRDRVFTFDGGGSVLVVPVAFSTVDEVLVDGVAVTDFVADGSAGLVYSGTTEGVTTFADGVRNVMVTVNVGPDAVPANVRLAARELVRHLWQMGRQGSRPAYGMESVDIVPAGFALPNRVVELLRPHANVGGFA